MAGYRTFVDGDNLNGTILNGYFMGQVVARFASAVERDAQLATPVAGMISYVVGVGHQRYDGSSWINLVTPAYTTAARPAAGTVQPGTAIFDTTLSAPVWSDGAAWITGGGGAGATGPAGPAGATGPAGPTGSGGEFTPVAISSTADLAALKAALVTAGIITIASDDYTGVSGGADALGTAIAPSTAQQFTPTESTTVAQIRAACEAAGTTYTVGLSATKTPTTSSWLAQATITTTPGTAGVYSDWTPLSTTVSLTAGTPVWLCLVGPGGRHGYGAGSASGQLNGSLDSTMWYGTDADFSNAITGYWSNVQVKP